MSGWIGIDLGTQSVRAMAVAADGRVLGTGSRPLTSHRDGPRHEQDPEQWWRELAAATREAMRSVDGPVEGVAVAATSGTILLTDPAGRPLTPALMYDDRRADATLANEVGAQVWERLGYRRMQPNWALPKLLWLLRDAPAGVRLAHQNDFVNRRLTGHPVATDLSNALKTGVDLVEERWPMDVFDALGVPGELLPEVVRPGTRLGVVCAAAAEETGIPAGTPVVAGSTDGCAAQLGAGALRPGSWNSVLGTTLVLKGVTEQLIHDPLGVVYSHRAPDGSWLPGGASSTGAGALTRDLPGRDLDALSAEAATRTPGTEFAVTYPLVSRGERFPFAAPDAETFTLGEPADDVERYAAILLGAAFVERLCFDYLDLLGAPVDGEIILTGGATRSAYWTRLRADVLERPVTLRENAEPALGMAVLAGGDPASMIRTRAVVEPSGADLREPYLRFVAELERRGWLDATAAAHARERTTTR
ncbi:FGGY-family carbohydrate kinase [Nonomuraea gerenzanensis]|uniref:Carbohydrate kinase, FGGY n=1 Tax=Nonomuraea gerenzanensis TaxID=93944 RepID=A0A1M4END5_9ACTN|nr:FGGY family carbohydrate kinase [Nonomuraea gerenzanensis]UBU11842.1 carbohydrate kinase [Nonomuraea gerenzanensis]SBP00349.1 carbohydrate kinase, FGGY [Nonomuraea gerenzanensis]